MRDAEIRLSYYKQGDDLRSCLVQLDDGKVHVPATLERHIALLQSSIIQLNEIRTLYLEMNPKDVTLDGDCHFMGISGPDDFIKKLITEDLADVDPFESDSDEEGKVSDEDVETVMNTLIQKNYQSTDIDDDSETEADHGVGSEIIRAEILQSC